MHKQEKSVFKAIGFIVLITLMSACNIRPIAKYSYSPIPATAMEPVRFDGTDSYDPDGEIIYYFWDFDDGKTSNDSVAVHFYESSSDYKVRLEVRDKKGKTGEVEQEIEVEPRDILSMVPDTSIFLMHPDSVGYLVVANYNGDLFELILPPGSVLEPTEITLIALSGETSIGMERLVTRGVRILPEGINLELPLSLIISYKDKIQVPEKVRIFNIENETKYSIVPWQIVTDSTIQGKLYHLSEYEAGTPNNSVVTEIGGDITVAETYNDPSDFEYEVGAINEFADLVEKLGKTDADTYRETAKEITRQKANQLLNEQLPSDPCNKYLDDFLRFGSVIGKTIPRESVTNQLREKANGLIDQCPMEANVHYKFFSIPPGIEGGLSDPIMISNNATPELTGGGPNKYWIGGNGFTSEGVTMRFIGSGHVDNSINGTIDVEPPFNITLTLSLSMKLLNLYFEVLGTFEGQTTPVIVITSENGNQVSADIMAPFGSLVFSGAAEPYQKDLFFYYVNGDKFIENAEGEGMVLRHIWTITIPNQ
jgi:PKD repeat protein